MFDKTDFHTVSRDVFGFERAISSDEKLVLGLFNIHYQLLALTEGLDRDLKEGGILHNRQSLSSWLQAGWQTKLKEVTSSRKRKALYDAIDFYYSTRNSLLGEFFGNSRLPRKAQVTLLSSVRYFFTSTLKEGALDYDN